MCYFTLQEVPVNDIEENTSLMRLKGFFFWEFDLRRREENLEELEV